MVRVNARFPLGVLVGLVLRDVSIRFSECTVQGLGLRLRDFMKAMIMIMDTKNPAWP